MIICGNADGIGRQVGFCWNARLEPCYSRGCGNSYKRPAPFCGLQMMGDHSGGIPSRPGFGVMAIHTHHHGHINTAVPPKKGPPQQSQLRSKSQLLPKADEFRLGAARLRMLTKGCRAACGEPLVPLITEEPQLEVRRLAGKHDAHTCP